MDQRLVDLYDEYTHTAMGRREFLARLARLAGGAAAASALLPLLENNYALAATVAPDDERLETGHLQYAGPRGKVRAYWARLRDRRGLFARKTRRAGVVIIHENRGLNAHIEDVTRRAALEGFLAVAPDALWASGGTPADADQARELIGKLVRDETLADCLAAADYLRGRKDCTGKVGAVGFCWGGGMVGQLAVADPRLAAGVVFYGMPPDPAAVPRIRAPLLLHYAGLDERINAAVPAFTEALTAAGVAFEAHTYAGKQHAFHNDTTAARYDAEAAALAWQRTVAFLKARLG
jgi:carboxymethylenebutenolidase